MKELEALLDISRSLSSSQDRQDVLYLLVKAIASVMDVTRCSVIVVDDESDRGRVLATYEDPALRELAINLGKYPEIQEAISTGGTVLVEDVEHDARMKDVVSLFRHLQIGSILVIPITFYDRVLGTLFLRTSQRQRAFTRSEVLFCQTASSMAASFLLSMTQHQILLEEKARLTDEAMRDPLTGLANRVCFARALHESVAYAGRNFQPVACLMIDADNFKSINDRFGHRRGDDVLKAIGNAITTTIRQSDVAARYGGDEFAVLLRDTDDRGAYTKAERIRSTVKALKIPDLPVTISVSIGIAVWKRDAAQHQDLLAEADRALYAAKSSGKDRTLPCFDGSPRQRSDAA